MEKNNYIGTSLVFGVVFLFIASAVTPMCVGNNIGTINIDAVKNTDDIVAVSSIDKYYFPEKVAREKYPDLDFLHDDNFGSEKEVDTKSNHRTTLNDKITERPISPADGPMDSPWPMYCHDVRHTGRSPYSTANNPYDVKWMFDIYGPVWGGPVIDEEGIIYIGSDSVYAIYPNGTLKWRYNDFIRIASTPAIDENGIIYVGAYWVGPQYMYAIYKNNGTLKWRFYVGEWIDSSPAIGDDGSIYFGSENDYIYALYPNGTLKWKYATGNYVLSSPAIGIDGTIYCGSNDCNLYALYPNNGTLKWKFSTGYYIRVSPCIADDGTIYCVSRDGYLYAVYSNGTMKWKTYVHAGTSPTIGWDGTIYAGWTDLYAVDPTNGSIKWTFNPGGAIEGSTPCNSIDGTIYLGNSDGSDIIAVNPDGTEKWRKYIGGDVASAPAIGSDGTVYIGDGRDDGSLHAFGPLDSNAPSAPNINGPTNGDVGTSYEYTFKSTSPLGHDVYYYIDWGDGAVEEWIGPYTSGQTVTVSHTWNVKGTYTIQARAKDTDSLWGPWGSLSVTMPLNLQISQHSSNQLFLKMMERFIARSTLLERLLNIQ